MNLVAHNLSKPWNVGGIPGRIECADTVWEQLITLAMAGFRSGPWGGPETGGLLFGRRTPGCLHIHGWREIACEHANGPAFELSKHDESGLEELLANSANDSGRIGEVVGWFQSKYYDLRWSQSTAGSLSLSSNDVDVHKRYFTEPWQVALIIQRAKTGPVRAGFHFRTADGALSLVERDYEALPPASPGKSVSWSQHHKDQLAAVHQCILSRRSIAMLIGEAGTGKTMLLGSLSALLTKARIDFAFLHQSGISVPTFYEMLASDLDLQTTDRGKRAVLVALGNLAMETDRGPIALLIDEAHNLPADVIEEIRLLDNLHVQNTKLLQIVLAGQPLLELRLQAPDLRSFKQRIARRYEVRNQIHSN